ncbi:MAG: leucine-rich repeat domain-containing protein [Lachnospiraceae bacterium]|nr:leucine-rich repeat domain-containing protein [Lachnospiraceae bacterium]
MNDIEYGFWRLRSQDMYGVEEVYKLTSCVNDVGSGFFTPVTEIIPLVRPALHISLSSTTWSYAGTVTSQGKIDEISKVDDEKGGDDTEQGTFTPAGNGQSEVKETTAPTGNDSSSDSGNDSSEKDSSSDGDDSSKENDDGKKTGETVKCTKLTTQKNTYTIRKNGEGVQIKFNLTTTPKNSLTKEKVTAKVKKAIVAKVTDKKLSRNSLVVTLEGVRNGTTTLNVSVGKATAKVKIKVQITGGTCGKHLTWKRKGTVLTIKGKGDMNNFTGEIVDGNVSYSNEGYWGKKDITKVIISSGVTSIGENAFVSMKKIKSISLPKTIKSIGRSAFFGCTALRSIKFGNNLKTIGSGAFCLCKSLKSITIPKSVQKIASVAFYECDKLNAIKILSKKCKIGEDALGIKPDENVLKGDGQVLVSGVKIYGLKGSTAEKYAKKYKIPFVKVK